MVYTKVPDDYSVGLKTTRMANFEQLATNTHSEAYDVMPVLT